MGRHWQGLLKAVVALLVAIGLFVVVRRSWRELSNSPLDWRNVAWGWLFVAGVCYAAGMSTAAVFWHQVLIRWGNQVPARRSCAAFFLSQLGKYLPGKAMVVVLRVAAVRGPQVRTSTAVVAVFVETLSWMAVGAAIGCTMLIAVAPDQRWLLVVGALLAVVALTAVSPPVIHWTLDRFRHDEVQAAGLQQTRLSWLTLMIGWAELAVGWLLVGFSLWSVLRAFPEAAVSLADYPLMLACVTLSVVLGFVSLLPGGLGVRELVITPLLAAQFGLPVALSCAVVLRLVWIVTELIMAGIMNATWARSR